MAEEAQKCVLDFFRSFLYESYEKCEEKNQNDIVVKPNSFTSARAPPFFPYLVCYFSLNSVYNVYY